MKVGIINISMFSSCPYMNKYTDALKRNNVPYDLIGWDRDGNEDDNGIIYFHHKSAEKKNIIKKIPEFIRYARFLNKKIKENKYDKIIILNTLTAFLLINHIRKYKDKFILDIRDLSYEYIGVFKKILGRIIDKSYFTCISSEGFLKELPENKKYIIAHNFQYKTLNEHLISDYKKNNDIPIKLLFIGIGRGDKYNKLLADIFGNNKLFQLNILGRGNDTEFFKKYVEKYHNVTVKGTYNDKEKNMFLDEADIIVYNYMSDFNCDCALANKYYDGLIFKKPLLGNSETYSGKLINEKGVGISISFSDKEYAEKLYDYYTKLNEKEYTDNVDKEIKRVIEEDSIYISKIEEFIIN